MIDLHNHSNFSPDSNATQNEIVEKAIEKNLLVIGISDHDDLDTSFPYSFRLRDPAGYLENLSLLKSNSPIKVLSGLEVGIGSSYNTPPDGEFDYFIYSVHSIPGINDLEIDNIWTLYLEESLEAIKGLTGPGFFGHIDFLRRYIKGHRELDNPALLDELLRKLAKSDIGIEINTSGWRAPYNEPTPQPWIIERYLRMGGRYITIGSDSHRACDVGSHVEKALSLLLDLGVREIFYCEKGTYMPLKIST
ncbi:MAG: histidinol-phosphatase HisJ family protein [Mesotoga infera]|jgi:histidinol-phosphatase (PHP family)|nr:histidinol-phosphatase HisJ family protein [Mesotoga infera]